MSDAFSLAIEGCPRLAVHSFEVCERSHVHGHARVVARTVPEDSALPDDLLGKRATLEVAAGDADHAEPRRFHGVVESIERSVSGVVFEIVPRLMVLADGADHRVFLEQDCVTISEGLLRDAALTTAIRVATRPKPRAQCVQAFESVLAFVRRILAEDGISIWVEHDEHEDVIVIGADASACPDLPGGARLQVKEDGGLLGGESVTEVEVSHKLTHDGAAVTDFDPDHPAVDQRASVGAGHLPLFVYPGRHRTQADGQARAQQFLDEAQADGTTLRAKTSSRRVAVGFIVELAGAARADHDGRYRVTEVRQYGHDFSAAVAEVPAVRYEAEFVAVPASRPTRPARELPRGLGGLQTMTVTSPSGQEIHTDSAGRIKARFRWDRISAADDKASAWLRPVQPPLTGGFFLPRSGWEVLVGFMSDPVPSGDTPVELGRLINAAAPPAESLPAQKVRSNWGSLSTPGGGKQNQLRFDDAAGGEGMLTGASNNYVERTENDKVVTVNGSEANQVGGSHVNSVAIQQATSVKGAQTYSVGGNRDVNTVGALAISAASETVMVGGVRKFTIGGDYETKAAAMARIVGAAKNVVAVQEANRHVSGASSIAVGATWAEVGGVSSAIGVLGASSTLGVGGPLSVSGSDISINASVLTESYGGLYRGHANGSFTIAAPDVKLQAATACRVKGADVFFRATARIVLKAGGVRITITPGSITVSGKLKSDSAAVVTTKGKVG